MGQLTAFVKCMCEPRPENRQRPRFRAAEYINRGGYKQLERDHCGYRIARQAEYRLAAAGPKNGRSRRPGRHRNRYKTRAPLGEGPFPKIAISHRDTPRKNLTIFFSTTLPAA